MERRLAELSVSVFNWHYSFSLSVSACLPSLYHSLSVSCPSGRSICLPSLSLSDLSFTMTRAIQKCTHTRAECQAAGAAVCVRAALSHISAYCSKESTPRLPHTLTAPLHAALTRSIMKRNTHFCNTNFCALWRLVLAAAGLWFA